MRTLVLLSAAALLALGGCSREEKAAPAENAASENEIGEGNRSEERSERDAPAEDEESRGKEGSERYTRDSRSGADEDRWSELVGRWSRDDNCERILEFREDGTVRAVDGAEGRWTTSGDIGDELRLRMRASGRDATVLVTRAGRDRLRLTNTGGGGEEGFEIRRCD